MAFYPQAVLSTYLHGSSQQASWLLVHTAHVTGWGLFQELFSFSFGSFGSLPGFGRMSQMRGKSVDK
jgi:hypothetical protein